MTEIFKHEPGQFRSFFSETLDGYLKSIQAPWPNTKVIRPSQIHECQRWIVGDILGRIPFESKSAVQQRVLDNGTYVHKRVLGKYLPRMGIVPYILDIKKAELKQFIEISLRDDSLWLKGSPDALIVNPNDGLVYVFELKSMRDGEFRILEDAKIEHIMQLHCYFWLTTLTNGILFYENKDNQQTKEFVIQKSDVLMNKILNKISLIQKAVLENNLNIPCENVGPNSCKCAKVMV
jgi:hypothetical protein